MDKIKHENMLLPNMSPIAALTLLSFNNDITVMISGIEVTIPSNNE
jgi:hypothetical protein